MLVFSTVTGIAIVYFSEEIISLLFGHSMEFQGAVSVLKIVCFVLLAFGPIGAIGSSFSGVGRPGVMARISAVVAVVMLGLDFILIPRFGLMGAAFAKASAWLVYAAITLYLLPGVLNIEVTRWHWSKLFVLSAVLYLVLVLTSPYIPGLAIKLLIFCMAIAGYIIVLLLTRSFDSTDRELVRKILRPTSR